MLDWLVKLKSDEKFLWLSKQLEKRRLDAMNTIRTKPVDLAGVVAREQAFGLLDGLEAVDAEVSEHIDQLTRKLSNA